MKWNRHTISTLITATAALILLAALPSAIRDTLESGRIYLFSQEFLTDLPQRFSGPGRLRFVIQPLIAILLGCRSGIADARDCRPPYLYALWLGQGQRLTLLRNGLSVVRDLVAMGIVLDAIAQGLIYGEIHPGAALLIGPILICIPYTLARALSNRVVRLLERRRLP